MIHPDSPLTRLITATVHPRGQHRAFLGLWAVQMPRGTLWAIEGNAARGSPDLLKAGLSNSLFDQNPAGTGAIVGYC
jgi:hypothetical protein